LAALSDLALSRSAIHPGYCHKLRTDIYRSRAVFVEAHSAIDIYLLNPLVSLINCSHVSN